MDSSKPLNDNNAAPAGTSASTGPSNSSANKINPLTDAALIDCACKHQQKLKFPPKAEERLKERLEEIRKDELFISRDKFSLFLYNAEHRQDSSRGLAALWEQALQGAIWVIKEHDLRERPFRYSDPNKPSEITEPDIEEISTYYRDAAEFEKILYGADQWYRDHFAHVLRVWLLGLYVIFEYANEDKLIAPPVTKMPEVNWMLYQKAEFYAAFTIAALTHDLGYPIQKVAKLNDALDRILQTTGGMEWQPTQVTFSLARHEVAQQMLKFISAKPQFIEFEDGDPIKEKDLKKNIGDRLKEYEKVTTDASLEALHHDETHPWGAVFRTQWKYHQKYSDSLEKLHHGLLSALLLQRKLLFFKEGEFALEEDYRFSLEEVRQFMIRREILRAMATHTCPAVYIINLLSIESLLFFCDEIQEWGRPFFSDLYGGKREPKSEVKLLQFDDKNVEWEVTVDELHLSSAAHWLLNSGRNLYRRFRSAPNTYTREIRVKFILKWKSDSRSFVAECVFDPPAKAGDAFKLLVFTGDNPGLSKDLRELIEHTTKSGKGAESSIQEVLKELAQATPK